MLKLVFYLLIIASFNIPCLVTQASEIKYLFRVESFIIKVSLIITGKNPETINLKLPELFGIDNYQPQKLKVLLEDLAGTYIIIDKFMYIKHKPSSRIQIDYELYDPSEIGNLYLYVLPKSFFLMGKYSLIIPQNLDKSFNKITFEFINYNGLILSNTENRGSLLKFHSSIKDVDEIFFAGGNFDNLKIPSTNSSMIYSKDLVLNKDLLHSYLSKTLISHNKFFISNSNKNFFIFLSDPKNPSDIEGFANKNLQVISLGNQVKFDYDIQRIIAHENIHRWLNPYSFGENNNFQGQNCWFIEGFSDYYADYLNYKNGLLSVSEYLKIYNQTLINYFTSPLKHSTNQMICRNPYNTEIFKIAYFKGYIIAHELNYLIQKYTDKKLNLDSYIRYLINLSRLNSNFHFTNDVLKKTLYLFTNIDFSNFVEQNVILGDISIVANFILDGKAKLIKKKVKSVEYDFDFMKSQHSWRIHGVKYNTDSHRAGLRNGQKILGITHTPKYTDFEIQTNKNSNVHIKLLNKFKELLIPQYIEKSAL